MAGAGFEGYLSIGGDDGPAFVAGQFHSDADWVEIEGANVLAGPVCANGHWVAVVARPPEGRQILAHEMTHCECTSSRSLDV